VLVVIGAGFCVLFVAGIVCAVVTREEPAEPSELALHPEREEAILAERRAREYQQMLSLNEEQTDQVAQIILSADCPAGQRAFSKSAYQYLESDRYDGRFRSSTAK